MDATYPFLAAALALEAKLVTVGYRVPGLPERMAATYEKVVKQGESRNLAPEDIAVALRFTVEMLLEPYNPVEPIMPMFKKRELESASEGLREPSTQMSDEERSSRLFALLRYAFRKVHAGSDTVHRWGRYALDVSGDHAKSGKLDPVTFFGIKEIIGAGETDKPQGFDDWIKDFMGDVRIPGWVPAGDVDYEDQWGAVVNEATNREKENPKGYEKRVENWELERQSRASEVEDAGVLSESEDEDGMLSDSEDGGLSSDDGF